jgi:hypothetical protein
VLLTVRFLDMAEITTVTPLSLLISCKSSFPIVDLKMSSLPILALKSHNRIFIWYLENFPVYKAENTAIGICHADRMNE